MKLFLCACLLQKLQDCNFNMIVYVQVGSNMRRSFMASHPSIFKKKIGSFPDGLSPAKY